VSLDNSETFTLAEALAKYKDQPFVETGHPHYTSREWWCAPAVVPYHQDRCVA
jgi:hypothetical protein